MSGGGGGGDQPGPCLDIADYPARSRCAHTKLARPLADPKRAKGRPSALPASLLHDTSRALPPSRPRFRRNAIELEEAQTSLRLRPAGRPELRPTSSFSLNFNCVSARATIRSSPDDKSEQLAMSANICTPSRRARKPADWPLVRSFALSLSRSFARNTLQAPPPPPRRFALFAKARPVA